MKNTVVLIAVIAVVLVGLAAILPFSLQPSPQMTSQALPESAGAAGAAKPVPEQAGGLQREEIEQIVRDYLVTNPEVMVDVMNALDEKTAAVERDRKRAALSENRRSLMESPYSFVSGNPNGSVTIVEFFDYQCGYCKAAFEPLMELLAANNDVRLVLKEFPVLGEVSVTAARAAIAAEKQGRYMELHTALMREDGRLSDERIMEIAEEVGLDTEQLAEDMESERVNETINHGYALADALGINGTPSFVIGDELVAGMPGPERMDELLDLARTGCVTC